MAFELDEFPCELQPAAVDSEAIELLEQLLARIRTPDGREEERIDDTLAALFGAFEAAGSKIEFGTNSEVSGAQNGDKDDDEEGRDNDKSHEILAVRVLRFFPRTGAEDGLGTFCTGSSPVSPAGEFLSSGAEAGLFHTRGSAEQNPPSCPRDASRWTSLLTQLER